jgi:hypothetical protein
MTTVTTPLNTLDKVSFTTPPYTLDKRHFAKPDLLWNLVHSSRVSSSCNNVQQCLSKDYGKDKQAIDVNCWLE